MSATDGGDDLEGLIRSSIATIAGDYDESYWREVHNDRHAFPREFWNDLAEGGWVGTAIPEEYGGQGFGLTELLWIVEECAKAGAWSMGIYLQFPALFGGETLSKHGTEAQKENWLPKIANGETDFGIGVTEPDAGLNTPNISTFAEKQGDNYVISGQKMWISGVERVDRIALLARTTSLDEVDRRSRGISIFLVDPEDSNVAYEEIPLDIFTPEPAYAVYLDDVEVPASDLVGEEDEGLRHFFDTLNAERILTAMMSNSSGRYALMKAAQYAKDREVFDAPIGSHQAIQHPLADAYADLETSREMIYKAARLYDAGEKANTESNVAMLKSSEAGWKASEAAMSTYGGMSVGREVGIAKIWGFVRHLRTGPVSEHMLRNFLAERELGLPRSY